MSYSNPNTNVDLGKTRGDTMASPLRPKSIVVEMPATPPTMRVHHNIYQAHMRSFHRSVHRGLVAT